VGLPGAHRALALVSSGKLKRFAARLSSRATAGGVPGLHKKGGTSQKHGRGRHLRLTCRPGATFLPSGELFCALSVRLAAGAEMPSAPCSGRIMKGNRTMAPTGEQKTKGARGGITAPVQPSPELAAIVGSDRLPRSEVVKKVWDYIKQNDLQNPKDKREILADAKLEKIFGAKKASMFEMNKHLARHLKA
jgi:hypothetical protein